MDSVMHIAADHRVVLNQLGLATPRALCGKKLRHGSARNAPLCPTCVRKAGWTHDKRK